MDFVMDALVNGRRVKCLTIVDDLTPAAIRTDQGPEYTGRALDQWAFCPGVQLKLIAAGKPAQNAFVERFKGRFRDECLNDHWFDSLNAARASSLRGGAITTSSARTVRSAIGRRRKSTRSAAGGLLRRRALVNQS